MTEAGYVERPVLGWLTGHGTQPGDPPPLGWTYRDAAAMNAFGRPDTDPFIEPLLITALKKINPVIVKTDDQAQTIVSVLRQIVALPDRLEANRRMLQLLRDGVSVILTPGQPPFLQAAIEELTKCLN
jgi:type I restriction enzyme R subunit